MAGNITTIGGSGGIRTHASEDTGVCVATRSQVRALKISAVADEVAHDNVVLSLVDTPETSVTGATGSDSCVAFEVFYMYLVYTPDGIVLASRYYITCKKMLFSNRRVQIYIWNRRLLDMRTDQGRWVQFVIRPGVCL